MLAQYSSRSVDDQFYAGGVWLKRYMKQLKAGARRAEADDVLDLGMHATMEEEFGEPDSLPVVGRCTIL